MKKSIIHSLESDAGQSIISCLETDCQGSIQAPFGWICPLPDEGNEGYHPPVKLRYMIDDYCELLFEKNLN